MELQLNWKCLATILFFLYMGACVHCQCNEVNIQIKGGNYTLTNGLNTGSMLIYSCHKGYYAYPVLSRSCQKNGKWKDPPKKFRPQECRLVECPDPNVMLNGNVDPPQEKYYVGNETTYECYSGYKLRGSKRRTCQANGKWSGKTPICSHDTSDHCADPGVPPGASRSGSVVFDIGDKVTYQCNSRLVLVGSKERECQQTGFWTGLEPACYYPHTYDTTSDVAHAFADSIRQTLTVSKGNDSVQEQRSIRLTKNGTLNIYIAVDISSSIDKDHIINAKSAVENLIKKIASFDVTPNYEIIFFSSDIYWISRLHDNLGNPRPAISFINDLKRFKISEHDNTEGTDLKQAFTIFLQAISLLKQNTGKNFTDHRHVIIFFTDGAYNMGGSPEPVVAQIKAMVYMNSTGEVGQQSREEYLDIYMFGIGHEIFVDDLQSLTTGLGGTHFFKLEGSEELDKAFDQMIDEREVIGLCGLHRTTDINDVSKRRIYPWLAFVVTKGRKCLGSLVSSKFVLTAAHCFRFGDEFSDVQVEIGVENNRLRKVERIHLHPRYNITARTNQGVEEFYDYDVALLQLEKDVTFSIEVRPICIPCTQQTSDALDLVGPSTCAQQEELLFKNERDQLHFLTKADSVQQKDVNAKLGGSRDACIRLSLKAPGISTTNPYVAVTDNFLCTGGLQPYRDHIACTGDSGGAVFKNYEQRTIQVALVSWGSKALCESGGLRESDEESRDFHINLFRVVPFLKDILGNDDQDAYVPLKFLV